MPATVHAYRLCEHCMRRQGDGAGDFQVAKRNQCFVCGGLMDTIPALATRAVRKVRIYQFKTFSVGVSLPEGVQEREDELRSDLKLRGNLTVKTQAAMMVAERVSAALRKSVDKFVPDLTLLLNLGNGEVGAASRPVFFYGKYTKPPGVFQHRELCRHCGGAGCSRCRSTGFERKPSVEEELQKKLQRFTGSEKMTFTWLGSEDRASRVYAPGRPFVVEIKNPVRRRFPRKFTVRFKGGQVAVLSGRFLPSKPLRLPTFRFRTEIRGTAASGVTTEALAQMKRSFRRAEVRFERPFHKPAMKMVYRASAKARGKTLVIDAELDGGLPVKRFVNGDLVSPSVSEVLKTEVRCRSFDICRVKETGEFEFAEIARNQKKN